MSIYATIFSLDGDGEHADPCAAFFEESPRVWESTGKPCDCPERFEKPITYQGSHVLPTLTDPRGGWLMFSSIPDHCSVDEVSRVEFARLSLGMSDYDDGSVDVILERKHIEELRDVLTAWLDAKERW